MTPADLTELRRGISYLREYVSHKGHATISPCNSSMCVKCQVGKLADTLERIADQAETDINRQ